MIISPKNSYEITDPNLGILALICLFHFLKEFLNKKTKIILKMLGVQINIFRILSSEYPIS